MRGSVLKRGGPTADGTGYDARLPAAALDALRLQFMSSHVTQNVLVGLVGFVAVALSLGDVAPTPFLVGWIAYGIAQSVARVLLARRWFDPDVQPGAPAIRVRLVELAVGAGLSGLAWGIGWIGLLPVMDQTDQLLYLFATIIFCAVGALSFGAWPPAFLALLGAAFLPLLPGIALLPGAHANLATAAVAACIALAGLARLFARQFRRMASLQHQKDALLARVAAERDAAVEARAQALRAREEMEAASRAKSLFLASASHDLRQPMHAINLYLDAMHTGRMPAREATIVERIRQCSAQMNGMFDSLLTVSRLDAGVVQPRIVPVDVAGLLRTLEVEFAPVAREARLRLRFHCASHAWVMADGALLLRVLGNLLSNALRYTERGSVLVACRRDAAGWRLEVRDSGPGIEAGAQRQVFDEFVQLQAGAHRGQGLGLGLAIVARLARRMDSEVRLRSAPGRGSVFSLVLPRVRPADTAAMTRRGVREAVVSVHEDGADVAPAMPAARDEDARVAVVIDDDPQVLHATCMLLETLGHEVLAARDLREAMERLSEADVSPALILSDHSIDDAGGEHVIAMLREDFNETIPALLVTGDTSPATLSGLRDPSIVVLHKPLDAARLREAIGQAIETARAAGD